MKDLVKLVAAISYLIFLTACGGSGSEKEPEPVVPIVEPVGEIPSFQKPSLSPQLDTSRASTETVGSRGGTLIATASDGTTFVLSIPPSALASDTLITMTPVQSIDNFPLQDGLTTAVDLQPAGLEFALPATLTISFANELPVFISGFDWSGANNSFAIQSSYIAEDRLSATVLIEHFSGYGLGIPGASQVDLVAGELIALSLEEEIAWETVWSCTGSTSCSNQELIDIAEFWFNLIVQPRLDDGNENAPVSKAMAGHEAFYNWVSYYNLIGRPPSLQPKFDSGYHLNFVNLLFQYIKYTQNIPEFTSGTWCTGAVANWQDWLRIPDEINIRITPLNTIEKIFFYPLTGDPWDESPTSCALLKAEFVDPPTTLDDQQSEIPLTLRTFVEHPSGTTPIAAQVNLTYSTGVTGEESFVTDTQSGEYTFEVDRDLTWPSFTIGAIVLEPALGRDEVLFAFGEVVVGQSALQFDSNVEPKDTLPLNAVEPLKISFAIDGVPIEGQEINFTLDGPGSLSSATASTVLINDRAVATIDYLTADHAVIKGLNANIYATTSYNGKNYEAQIRFYPYWVNIELAVNNGTALINATNDSVEVLGDGPFSIHAIITGAGFNSADPGVPMNEPDDNVVFETIGPVEATLNQEGGNCCDVSVTVPVNDSNGTGIAEWTPLGNDEQENHSIEVRYNNVSATVNIMRTQITYFDVQIVMFPAYPDLLLQGESASLSVITGIGNTYWVEISAPGAELGAVGGLSDPGTGLFQTTVTPLPGYSCVAVDVNVFTQSGGELIGNTQYPATVGVRVVAGASLNMNSLLFVDVVDDSNTNHDSDQANLIMSPHACDLINQAGPLQSKEVEIEASIFYGGIDPVCVGANAEGKVSRSVQLQKNSDLSQIDISLSATAETLNSSFSGCFNPPGNSQSDAYGEKGGILELAEPAFITVSNLQASVGGGESCGTAIVYFAQASPVGDGYGSGLRYACVRSSGLSGDSAVCPASGGAEVPPTSFAGELPAGRYQINANTSADYENLSVCTVQLSAEISILPGL